MSRSLIQNVLAVVVLGSAVLSPGSTMDTTTNLPSETDPEKLLKGPVGNLVKLGSVDEIPVLNVEDSSDVLKVIVVTRHGMYTPVGPSTLEGDKQKNFQSDPPLKITEKGKDLMELVGKSLMKRYEAHFSRMTKYPSYEEENLVKVTATDTEIGRESAEKLIAGMKAQSPESEEKWKLTLSPDNIEKNEYFNPLLLSKQDANKCKIFSEMAKKLKDPEKVKAPLPQYKQQSLEDVFKQFDRLQMERLEGLELPDWTKKDEGLETLTNMKRLAIIRMANLIGFDIAYWKYFISTIFNNISKDIETPDKPHFHLHVVDDHLMTALVWWLRMDSVIPKAFGSPVHADHYPQAGDSLVIEIDQMDPNWGEKFRVFYLRPVGESGSQVGFKQLDLQTKAYSDYLHVPSNVPLEESEILPDSKRGDVHLHYFYAIHFIKENEWSESCRA